MLSIKKIVVVVLLPLMFGAIILAALQGIKSDQLKIWQENARKDINQEARHFVIGQSPTGEGTASPRVAKEQFRGLVIYSQISSVNCQIMYWIHAEDENGDRVSQYLEGRFQPGKIGQNSDHKIKYTIPGRGSTDRDQLFNYLDRANYVPTCVGTSNQIDSFLVSKGVKSLRKGNMIQAALGFIIGQGTNLMKNIWNAATCKLEPSFLASRGNDMEGRFGKITFESEVTIFPAKDSNGRIWSAQFLNNVGNCPANNEEILGPAFFEAGEWMDWLPWPDSGTPRENDYGVNGEDPPFVEYSSAQSDAIIDAPALTNRDLEDYDVQDELSSSTVEGGEGYGDFPRKDVYYVICEGASGFVRTDANSIWNLGEAVWGKDNKRIGEYQGYETRTFTKVRVQENAMDCLENRHYNDDIYTVGELYSSGPECSSLEDANDEKTASYYNGDYECALVKYQWNGPHNGDKITDVWMIGWTEIS